MPTQTLKDIYCQLHDCRPEEFNRRAFRAAAYPHVRLLSLLPIHRAHHFSPDRALIDYCGILRSPRQIAAEVQEFSQLAENRGFVRRVLLLRVSGRRLKLLADECFRRAAATPDPDAGADVSAIREPVMPR